MDPTKKPPPVSNPYGKVPQYKPNEHSKPTESERKRADSDPTVPTGSPEPASPTGRRYFASESSRPRFRPPQALQPNVLPLRLAARASSSSEEIPPRASSSSKSQELIESLERGSGQEKIGEILGSIGEIPYAPVKLNVLLQLVSRINEKFDSASAAKLIAEHVEPMARNFAASMDFAPTSKVGAKVQELYATMRMPVEPVWALRAQVVSAAQEPEVRSQEPVVRDPVPRKVEKNVVTALRIIGWLQPADQKKFEAACEGILDIVSGIRDQRDKLDVLTELVSQINASSEPDLAGKIFVKRLEPYVTDFLAAMPVADNSAEDEIFRKLYEAMSEPMGLYLVSQGR
jgi:hypothetical protein